MRIDVQYLKDFLEIILDNDHPDFNINHKYIKPLWDTDENIKKLIFHLEILEDQNLIESAINSNNIGFGRAGNGSFIVNVIPLRLTALGHQFAADLSKPGVIEKLKDSFKDAGPIEAVKVVFELGKKILEKKLDGIM